MRGRCCVFQLTGWSRLFFVRLCTLSPQRCVTRGSAPCADDTVVDVLKPFPTPPPLLPSTPTPRPAFPIFNIRVDVDLCPYSFPHTHTPWTRRTLTNAHTHTHTPTTARSSLVQPRTRNVSRALPLSTASGESKLFLGFSHTPFLGSGVTSKHTSSTTLTTPQLPPVPSLPPPPSVKGWGCIFVDGCFQFAFHACTIPPPPPISTRRRSLSHCNNGRQTGDG